jgi:CheY-like chemotaxis protein
MFRLSLAENHGVRELSQTVSEGHGNFRVEPSAAACATLCLHPRNRFYSVILLFMANVLCIGADAFLLKTRCEILESSGYRCDLQLPSDAVAVLESRQFEVVVLCSSLTDLERQRLLHHIAGRIPVVELTQFAWPSYLLESVRAATAGASAASAATNPHAA